MTRERYPKERILVIGKRHTCQGRTIKCSEDSTKRSAILKAERREMERNRLARIDWEDRNKDQSISIGTERSRE